MKPLSMAAVDATLQVSRYLRLHPGSELGRAMLSLQRMAAYESFDYGAATAWETHLQAISRLPDIDRQSQIRWLCSTILKAAPPWWSASVSQGRKAVERLADENAVQCLRAAGLFENPPSEGVTSWWDDLDGYLRAVRHAHQLELGRTGETLTLAYERERLAAAGRSDLVPTWMSIDDNTVGYDILSFEVSDTQVKERFIEVKASVLDPPVIHLTRNEWRAAQTYAGQFMVHVWKLPEAHLTELTALELADCIPLDRTDSRWQDLAITVRR